MIFNMLVHSFSDGTLYSVSAAESARITTTGNLRIVFPSQGYYYVAGYGNRYDPHNSTVTASAGADIREMDAGTSDGQYWRILFVTTAGANESLTVTKTRSGSFTFYVIYESGTTAPVFATI